MHIKKLTEGFIAAGTAFFGALVGLGLAEALPDGIWGAAVAAGVAFFASLKANGSLEKHRNNHGGNGGE